MINSKEQYFNDNCYFLLEKKGVNLILSYSIYETLNESKNIPSKKKFNKSKEKEVKKVIDKTLKSKNKVSKTHLEKELSSISKDGEIEEFVDIDGTMLSSKVPFLDMTMHPKKTMDQTVNAARSRIDYYMNPRRSYGWGESVQDSDEVISETDMSDSFGFKENQFNDMKQTLKKLDDMGIKEPDNKLSRARKMGKRRDTKLVKNKKGEKVLKNLNLFEKETLDEIKRQKMIKMVEDIISKKDKGESDVLSKDNPMSRLLTKNLESIKKLAEKEGISINKLINILKKGE